MSDPADPLSGGTPGPGTSGPGRTPGDREPGDLEPGDRRPRGLPRLETPPSQRYASTAPGDLPADEPSEARGLVFAALVAAFCAAILVVLGGAFGFTAGLIVVAFFLGRLTAIGMTVGAGRSVSTARRMGASIAIALLAVLMAQLGLWVWARAEGGVLGPIDFLAQTYGALVPLELLLAGGAAWLKAS